MKNARLLHKPILALSVPLSLSFSFLVPLIALAQSAAGSPATTSSSLNLSSATANQKAPNTSAVQIRVGGSLSKGSLVGGNSMTVLPGQLLTPAQNAALAGAMQGHQTLLVGAQGTAIGGSLNLNSSNLQNFSSLVVPSGVSLAAIGYNKNTPLNVNGALNISGSVHLLQNAANMMAVLNLGSLTVNSGGELSSYLPAGLSGTAGLFASAGMQLNVAGNVINQGIVTTPGDLNIAAAGSISNQSLNNVQASMLAQNINLLTGTGSIINSGLMSAANDINISTLSPAVNLLIDNTAGVEALNTINIRDTLYTGSAGTYFQSGDWLSETMNLNCGSGTVIGNINNVTGTVNMNGGFADISVNTGEWRLGNVSLLTDPILDNSGGDVRLSGDINTGGGDLMIVASKNIVIDGTYSRTQNALITTTSSGGVRSGNVFLVAGASVGGSAGSTTPNPMNQGSANIVSGKTVTAKAGANGAIDLTGVAGKGLTNLIDTTGSASGDAGGTVTMVAYGGPINLPNLPILTGGNAGGTSDNGNVLLMGKGVTVAGSIDSSQGAGSGGDIIVYSANPSLTLQVQGTNNSAGISSQMTVVNLSGTPVNFSNGNSTYFLESNPTVFADTISTGALTARTNINVVGNGNITSGSLTTTAVTAGQTLSVSGNGTMSLAAVSNPGGNVSISNKSSSGTTTISSIDTKAAAGGSVTITGTNISIGTDILTTASAGNGGAVAIDMTAAANAVLNIGGQINTTASDTGGDVSIIANQTNSTVEIDGGIDTGGATGPGGIQVIANSSTDLTINADIASPGINTIGPLLANGAGTSNTVQISNTGGNVVLAEAGNAISTIAQVTIQAPAGSILGSGAGNGTVQVSSSSVGVALTALNDIGNGSNILSTDVSILSAVADTGAVNIANNSAGALNINGVTAKNDITISATNGIVIAGTITSNSNSNISLSTSSSGISRSGAFSIVTGGNLSLSAPGAGGDIGTGFSGSQDILTQAGSLTAAASRSVFLTQAGTTSITGSNSAGNNGYNISSSSGDINVDTDITTTSGPITLSANGNINIGNGKTLTSAGDITIGETNGTFTNAGQLLGSSSFAFKGSGNATFLNNGTIDVPGANPISIDFPAGGTLNLPTGTLQAFFNNNDVAITSAGALTINASGFAGTAGFSSPGTYSVTESASGGISFTSSTFGSTITFPTNTTISSSGNTSVGNGLILQSSGTLTFNANDGTFTNNGTVQSTAGTVDSITIQSNGALTLDGIGALDASTGAGSILIKVPGNIGSTQQLFLSNGLAQTITGNKDVSFEATTQSLLVSIPGGGTAQFIGSGEYKLLQDTGSNAILGSGISADFFSFGGNLTSSAPGTTVISSNATVQSTGQITIQSATFENDGLIRSSSGLANNLLLQRPGANVSLKGTGSIDVSAGSGSVLVSTGNNSTVGFLTNVQQTIVGNRDVTFTSSGGSLQLLTIVGSTAFLGTGNYIVQSGGGDVTFAKSGGSGTFSFGGPLTVTSGAAININTDVSNTNGALALSGSDTNIAAGKTLGSTGNVTIASSTLTNSGTISSTGSFTFQGSTSSTIANLGIINSTGTATFDFPAGGTFNIPSGSILSFVNNNPIAITSSGNLAINVSGAAGTAGFGSTVPYTLTESAAGGFSFTSSNPGSTLSFPADTTITSSGNISTANGLTLSSAGTLTFDATNGTVTNNGTIQSLAGTADSITMLSTGNMTLDGTGTLDASGAAGSILMKFTSGGFPILNFNSGLNQTIAGNKNVTIEATNGTLSNTLLGGGTATFTGSGLYTIKRDTTTVTNFQGTGTFDFGGPVTLTAVGGIFSVANSTTLRSSGQISITGTINNNGTIISTSGLPNNIKLGGASGASISGTGNLDVSAGAGSLLIDTGTNGILVLQAGIQQTMVGNRDVSIIGTGSVEVRATAGGTNRFIGTGNYTVQDSGSGVLFSIGGPAGTILFDGPLTASSSKSITVNSKLTLSSGDILTFNVNDASFTNNGTVKSSSALLSNNIVIQSNGSLSLAGTGNLDVSASPTGSVLISSGAGGTVDLAAGMNQTLVGGKNLAISSSLGTMGVNVSGGPNGTAQFTGTGTYSVQNTSGGISFTQSNTGNTLAFGGNVNVSASTSIQLSGLTLSSTGSIDVSTSGGLISGGPLISNNITLNATNGSIVVSTQDSGTLTAGLTGATANSISVINTGLLNFAISASGAGDTISLNNTGDLTLISDINGPGGVTITLNAGSSIDNGVFKFISSNSPITLNMDVYALAGANPVNAGTGTVSIVPVSANRPITIGTTGASLHFSDTELNGITAGQINIGSTTQSGGVTVTSPLSLTGNLQLLQGANSIFNSGGQAISLSGNGSLGVSLVSGNITIGTITNTSNTGSVILQTDGQASIITLPGVLPVSHQLGILAGAGTIQGLPAASAIVIDASIIPRDSSGNGGSIFLSGFNLTSKTWTLDASGAALGGNGGTASWTNTDSGAFSPTAALLSINISGDNAGKAVISTGGNLSLDPALGALNFTAKNGNGADITLTAGSVATGNLLVKGSLNASGSNSGNGGSVTLNSNSKTAFLIGNAGVNGIKGTLSVAAGTTGSTNGNISISNKAGGITNSLNAITLVNNLSFDTTGASAGTLVLSKPLGDSNTSSIRLIAGGTGTVLPGANLLTTKATGSIDLSSGSGTINATISTGSISANTGGKAGVTLLNKSGNPILVGGTANVLSSGAGAAFSLTSNSDMATSGDIFAGTTLALKSNATAKNAPSINVSITVNDDLFAGTLTSGTATLTTTGSGSITGAGTIGAKTLNLTTTTGSLGLGFGFGGTPLLVVAASLNAAKTTGLVNIANQGFGTETFKVNSLKTTGTTVQVQSSNSMTFTPALKGLTGELLSSANGNLTVNGSQTAASNDISLSAKGNIAGSGTISTSAVGSTVFLTTTNAAANIGSTAAFKLNTPTIDISANPSASGLMNISSNRSAGVTIAGTGLNTTGNVTFSSSGPAGIGTVSGAAVTLKLAGVSSSSDVIATAALNVTQTGSGSLTMADLSAGSAMSLSSAGSLTTGDITAHTNVAASTGAVKITSKGTSTFGVISTSGTSSSVSITQAGGGQLSLDAATAGTTLTITTSGAGAPAGIATTGNLQAGGNITLKNTGTNAGITLGGNVSSSSLTSIVSLTASGNGAIVSPVGTISGKTINLKSGTGQFGLGTLSLGALKISSPASTLSLSANTKGQVNITNTSPVPMTLTLANTDNLPFSLRSAANLTLTSTLANASQILLDTSSAVAGGNILVNGGTLGGATKTTDVSLTSKSGNISGKSTITTTGTGTGVTLTSVSGNLFGSSSSTALKINTPHLLAATTGGTVNLSNSNSAATGSTYGAITGSLISLTTANSSTFSGNITTSGSGTGDINIIESKGLLTVDNNVIFHAAGTTARIFLQEKTDVSGAGITLSNGSKLETVASTVKPSSISTLSFPALGQVSLIVGAQLPGFTVLGSLPGFTVTGGGAIVVNNAAKVSNIVASSSFINFTGLTAAVFQPGNNGKITVTSATLAPDPPVTTAALLAVSDVSKQVNYANNSLSNPASAYFRANSAGLYSSSSSGNSASLSSPASAYFLPNSAALYSSSSSGYAASLSSPASAYFLPNSAALYTRSSSGNAASLSTPGRVGFQSASKTLRGAISSSYSDSDAIDAVVLASDRNLGQNTDCSKLYRDAAVSGKKNVITLQNGKIVVAPFIDTTVETPFGSVCVNAKSIAMIFVSKKGTAVFNLDDRHRDAVRIYAAYRRLSVAPGRQIMISSAAARNFGQVNSAEEIAYRGITDQEIGNGLKIFKAEFSVPSAINSIKPLKLLLNSKNTDALKLAVHLRKTVAAMLHMNKAAERYEQFLPPDIAAFR